MEVEEEARREEENEGELKRSQRNRRGQQMSLTFFRRWLPYEQEIMLSRQAARGSSRSFLVGAGCQN